ncbi:MAG TPA: riboflavin synthase [Myxococcales bacterium]|jgi:riboflavin synthase
MFTGLVQDLGTVASLARGPMTRVAVSTALPAHEFALGESIALDGACLTVVSRTQGRFEVEASPETLRRTTLGSWAPGTRVNLERALQLSDRLGGHLVLGHVDAVSRVLSRRTEGGSQVLEFALERALAPFLIEKGSIAVDGVSLTVNSVGEDRFAVQLIPETQRRTTLSDKGVGAPVNLETDVLGKYVARLLGKAAPAGAAGIDEGFLKRCGFQ